MKKNILKVFIFSISFLILMLSVFVSQAQTLTFTSSGSWTAPCGVFSVQVETWGGGGAGGGSNSTNRAGGGGGGGGYSRTTIAVIPGNSYNYLVGAGGVGANNTDGTDGGLSSFNGTVISNGGIGGKVGTILGAGGTGTGVVNFTGGSGAAGVNGTASGGGGASAATTANGSPGVGSTGGTLVGSGVGGNGRTAASSGDGVAGSVIGGGGGGAYRNGNNKGGDGARGQVRITFSVVVNVAPTLQPTALVLTPNPTNINGSFTASATADAYLVIRTTTAAQPANPVNNTTYTVGAAYGGTGTVVSVNGSTSFNATGLTTSTQYWIWVYAYTVGCAGATKYLVTSPLNGTTTTLACIASTTQGTSLVLTPGVNNINGSFSAGANADGYLVIRTTTAAAPSNPVNGTTYIAGASALGGIVVSSSAVTTFNATGLLQSTQYWFWIYSFRTCASISYLTTSPLNGTSTTLACVTGVTQPTSLILTPGLNNINGAFTDGLNEDGYLVVMTTTASAPTNPVNGTTYTVGASALGGTIISASAATTFNATGLLQSTQYWFWIYSYRTCASISYLTTSPLNGTSTTLACVTGVTQPTSLILAPGLNNINGAFTDGLNEDGYLVVMTTTASAPSNPVNGTTYTVGASALGGTIISASTAITFNVTGLSPATQYWFWIYSYKTCGGVISYLIPSPLTGTSTTLACGVPVDTARITTAGTFNWSTLPWSSGNPPTSCENALIIVDRSAATSSETVTINYDVDFTVVNFTMRNISNTPFRIVVANTGTRTINVTGDFTIECPGGPLGNRFNRCVYSNPGSTTINGNVTLGRPIALTTATEGHCAIGSNGSTPGQTYTMFGNLTFNPRGYTTDEWAVFIFNKAGTQYIYNNTRPLTTDTSQAVLFEDIRIGTTNATTLIFGGTGFDAYIEYVGRAGVTVGVNSTLDLPANYSLNNIQGGTASFFKLLAGARLKLGGDRSMPEASGPAQGNPYGVAGSNFPTGLVYTFDPTSTIEYNGNNTLTQTIYNAVTYTNLVASNVSGIGRAQKITTAPITVNNSFNINALADVTLGTAGSSTQTVASVGPLNINTNGGLYCNANVVSGAGAFTMATNSTLGMGHAQGIGTGATGNIQMTGTRTFSTTGNYVYNGIVNQITGLDLPSSAINNLTIDNANTVTIANNQLVNGITNLSKGTFDIGTTQFTSNGAGTLTSVTGKMKADLGTVQMSGTSGSAQNLSGNWFVSKTIANLIDANTTGITVAASPADTLLISTTLNYGSGTTGSTINTGDNLTLMSRLATGTANFGNATNNFITGKVNIERYLFARSAWRFLATPIQPGTSPTLSQAWRESNASLSSTGYGTRITGPTGPFGAAGVLDESTQRGSFKTYNSATNAWVETTNANATSIASTKGRLVFVRGDRGVGIGGSAATNLRIKGDILTGNQVFAVPANKFESFGNPYPARIDFRLVLKSNIANAFTVWNPNSFGQFNVGAYETFVWDGTNYRRGAVNRNFIESGEAVFVQGNTASAGSVTVEELDKATGSANVSRAGVTVPTLEINMYAQNLDGTSYFADGILMNFDNNYSTIVDNDDVRKITNSFDNIGIKNGTFNLVAERRPNLTENDSIQLSISGMRIAPYQLEIDPSVLTGQGVEAIFKDKFLQTETPLSLVDVTNINFNCTSDAASRASDRFLIVFKSVPTSFTTIAAIRNADKTITVNWGTQNETRVTNYTIEQSNDGVNFVSIATENPLLNNGGNPTYSKIDVNATANKNWYRVRLNNAGGVVKYSAIAMVNEFTTTVIAAEPKISVTPNPIVGGKVNLHLDNQPVGNYSLVISNKLGQVLQNVNTKVTGTNKIETINIGLANAGAYQVTITNEEGKKTTIPFVIK